MQVPSIHQIFFFLRKDIAILSLLKIHIHVHSSDNFCLDSQNCQYSIYNFKVKNLSNSWEVVYTCMLQYMQLIIHVLTLLLQLPYMYSFAVKQPLCFSAICQNAIIDHLHISDLIPKLYVFFLSHFFRSFSQHACLECGRSWVRALVESIQRL